MSKRPVLHQEFDNCFEFHCV